MPVIVAGRTHSASLDRVRIDRAARLPQLCHALLAASARRHGRRYSAPPCTLDSHAAIKANEQTFDAATLHHRAWAGTGMRCADCAACNSTLCLRIGAA